MDKEIEIKEEDLRTDDITSQSERQFFQNVVSIKTSTDTVLLDTDCDMTVKTEIKSETPFFKHLVKQIKSETPIWSFNCDIDKSNEVEQDEGEFLPQNPEMIDKKYNRDHEIDSKIEIKEEPWWLERETSSLANNIKDAVLPPIKSSRLFPETVLVATLGKSPSFSAEAPTRDTSFSNGIDRLEYDYKKCDATCDVVTATEYVHSDQYGKCTEGADTFIGPLCLKHSSLSDVSKTTQESSICKKTFSTVSNLLKHYLINGCKKTHQKVCDLSIAPLSHLKARTLVHKGKESHHCKVCDKRFTHLSDLKAHNLVHEGKKLLQCKVCNKSFTHLSNLKRHNLVHEGKKPHKCEVCDKSFTQLSNLKVHNLIHEGKKPHQCKVCDKSFTQLSTLKTHTLIHEGKKEHQCKVCDKSFTQLSTLKIHTSIHEGQRAYQCKLCDKSFTWLSNLKTHNLVHEGKKPHHCKVCDRRFTQWSHLKAHILVHEGKKPHPCKDCHKSFSRLSNLKRHNLLHEGKKSH